MRTDEKWEDGEGLKKEREQKIEEIMKWELEGKKRGIVMER